jgi:hypothetical protein
MLPPAAAHQNALPSQPNARPPANFALRRQKKDARFLIPGEPERIYCRGWSRGGWPKGRASTAPALHLGRPVLSADRSTVVSPRNSSENDFQQEDRMQNSQATPADAELVLRLYDMRRESEMRKARNWFVEEFQPRGFADVEAVFSQFGTQQNRWLRQVISYWDMAAALVLRGALNAALFQDTCGEAWFTYAKMKASLPEARAKFSPEFMASLEKVVEGTAEGRERLQRVEGMLAYMKKMAEENPKKKTAA